MSIDAGYGNPVDFLRYVLRCQDWGDNATGVPSASARIRTGVGVEGSFDSVTLDTVRAIHIRLLVNEQISTKDMVDKICKQFNLLQYTDVDGYECVKYLFATSSDVTIPTYVIGDTQAVDALEYPDTSKICVNPRVNYNYDYATSTYKSSVYLDNVQRGTYNPAYAVGFSAGSGFIYWDKCRSELWPLVRRVEDMDTEWRDNEFIIDYRGALLRLDNIIKMMRMKKLSITVPYELGYSLKIGRIIIVSFAHLSYLGDKDYQFVITGISESKVGNTVSITGYLQNEVDSLLYYGSDSLLIYSEDGVINYRRIQ